MILDLHIPLAVGAMGFPVLSAACQGHVGKALIRVRRTGRGGRVGCLVIFKTLYYTDGHGLDYAKLSAHYLIGPSRIVVFLTSFSNLTCLLPSLLTCSVSRLKAAPRMIQGRQSLSQRKEHSRQGCCKVSLRPTRTLPKPTVLWG